jgi:transcriptional regulator with XRE-family HTH domain
MSSIGRRLQLFREYSKLSQAQLADRLGLGRTFLSKIENDRQQLPTEAMARLCTELGVSLDWLLAGEGDMLRAGNALGGVGSGQAALLRERLAALEKEFAEDLSDLSARIGREMSGLRGILDEVTATDRPSAT